VAPVRRRDFFLPFDGVASEISYCGEITINEEHFEFSLFSSSPIEWRIEIIPLL
jgi:hypothetical protein